MADRYRNIPAPDADRSYYCDWDSGRDVLAGRQGRRRVLGGTLRPDRGRPEAGKAPARATDLRGAASREETEAALFSIALCSARSLLITRGIEAATDTAVFENFRKHFLESGLIDSNFEPVIAAAQQTDTLEPIRQQVFALLDAVDALYRGMDNSLRFTAAPGKF
jgi:hypothetical protein